MKPEAEQLSVLLNLAAGFKADFNICDAAFQQRVPAILTTLRRKCLIDKNLKLTEKGKEAAGLILTLTCEHFTDVRKKCTRCTRKTCAACKYCRNCQGQKK